MSNSGSEIREKVQAFCAEIGRDSLLVQGAGGNVSWKDGATLWVKASGTWLAEADKKNIFIPVDLAQLRGAIAEKDFTAKPRVLGDFPLRPSIETMLHALMPHKVVVHLHAVEILVHLVRSGCEDYLAKVLGDSVPNVVVGYFKPGADLAAAVNDALMEVPSADVIFLKNHGVVIGGDDIPSIRSLLSRITGLLATEPITDVSNTAGLTELPKQLQNKYMPVEDSGIQQLALRPELFNRLTTDWALYPDHVVFLGHKAYVYESWQELEEVIITSGEYPELVFIKGYGVFVRPSFNKTKHMQLRCYFDVIARQVTHRKLISLTGQDIVQLLNWDAEMYRICISA